MKLVTFAIVETGGKQYRIEPGDMIRVETLPGDTGDMVTLDDVRMVSQDGAVTMGSPRVEGASVTAEVVEQGKRKKVVVFKYKAKTRYRRKNGHRQHYTALLINAINTA